MVLVFEPITWEDGVGGFRAEEIVAVTDDGYEVLSHVDTSSLELTMRDHLDLLTSAMADSGTDVLMLGRPGNARWVTGAETPCAVSGTRAFAPGCVVVREPTSVHLLSNTDEGVPADVAPASNLFPISWNPMNLMGALAAIPGLPTRPASASTRSRR